MLGEFEYALITATVRLGDEAYGASIRSEIEHFMNRTCSIGALYTTLDRLEAKGLVQTWMGEATAERGGRSKRMVRVTSKGIKAATEFYRAVMNISSGIPWQQKPEGRKS
jgi:PadR family transcriptional regulator, regulatory protein PadR